MGKIIKKGLKIWIIKVKEPIFAKQKNKITITALKLI